MKTVSTKVKPSEEFKDEREIERENINYIRSKKRLSQIHFPVVLNMNSGLNVDTSNIQRVESMRGEIDDKHDKPEYEFFDNNENSDFNHLFSTEPVVNPYKKSRKSGNRASKRISDVSFTSASPRSSTSSNISCSSIEPMFNNNNNNKKKSLFSMCCFWFGRV